RAGQRLPFSTRRGASRRADPVSRSGREDARGAARAERARVAVSRRLRAGPRMTDFRDDAEWARDEDEADPLARFRGEFAFPDHVELYFAGHSLGLMPRRARDYVLAELDAWARRAVDGHLEGERPWLPYHEQLTGPVARLLGARPGEVVVMNSVTVNLHLMLVSFYRPTRSRFRIVVQEAAFPSDRYAVAS